MWPLIIRALLIGTSVYVIKKLFSSDEVKLTKESNCHHEFLQFIDTISISQEKKSNLSSAHNAIRVKLINYFSKYSFTSQIDFFIQGSHKMGTMVENMNQFSDIDLGVYFQNKPEIEIERLQWHIKKALTGHTSKDIEIKKMCVRLNYVRDFHIDLPIYFKDYKGNIFFGNKNKGWKKSDPKDFISWFKRSTKNKPQLIRIIKYLKAWSDYRKYQTGKKYPSGLVLTIWVIEYYEKHQRDDVSMIFTCDSILRYLDEKYSYEWEAIMPVAPFDNTLDRLTKSQKEYFYDDFKNMIEIGIEAIEASKFIQAKNKWKLVFGYRFK